MATIRTGLRAGRTPLMMLTLIGGPLSSGCATDGSCPSLFRGPRPGITTVVQRPTYEIPETKPLFLGGYAGANYAPVPELGP